MEQNVVINFAKGIDTKTDPWQVQIGQFQQLENSVFQKGGLLQKRPGYGLISTDTPPSAYLTTLNNNLTSVGETINAYSSSLQKWITKGRLQPCSLNVLPLIRNNLNQVFADAAVSNNLVLTAFTETNNTTTATVTQYLYVIADATTGQNITAPAIVPLLSTGTIQGSSKVFVVGNYFVIVTPVTVSGSTKLQYVSIPILSPIKADGTANVSAAQTVTSETYVPISSNPGWDGVSVNTVGQNVLVVAYNSSNGGQGVHIAQLTQQQIATNGSSSIIKAYTNAAYIAAVLTICVDLTENPNLFYVSFWNSSTTNGYTFCVYIGFGTITERFAPQQSITGLAVVNITSAAQNGSCQLYYEVTNNYSYDSAIPTDYIGSVSVSRTGTIGTPFISVRSVGLASEAFIDGGEIYYLSTYQSTFQPSYFLINATESTSAHPIITAKLAYQNGGGYLRLGLPSVTLNNGLAQIPYLYKDDVEALNTLNNPQQTTIGGIYSQTGINLVSFKLTTTAISTAEIANNLHVSGGYLSQYDGYLPVEHNFFLFPDNIECTYNPTSSVSPTATFSSGATTITVSSATGIFPGMLVLDSTNPSYITSGTQVVFVSGTTVTISKPTTHAAAGDTMVIQGNILAVPVGGAAGAGAYYYQATYEWTDNQGLAYRSAPSIPVSITTTGAGDAGTVTVNVPTLRLTAKIANKVKIVIYRWSEFTQVYNQVTSITAPVLNDTTVDSVSFVDTLNDTLVLGNNILYTTGGVVPDANAPSTDIVTLFDTRVWTQNAENPYEFWVSKQVLAGTPVEMSQLFTINIAPTTGTTSSLGPPTAAYPMDDKFIIFFKNGIYYINGVGPDNLGTTAVGCSLGNYSQPIFVTSVVGCTNQKSIVLTQDGLMFQSDKGIWLLGRNLQTQYIGAPVEDYNDFTINSAQVIPETNHVLFTLNNNQFLMYDYYFGQWGTFTGVSAISGCIYQGLHTILDEFGRILQQTPGAYLDVENPVLMKFKTSWFNIATIQGYERFRDFYLLARYLSPHKLLCKVAYNYNDSVYNQALLSPKNFAPSVPGPFGVPTPVGVPDDKEQWRVHAKQQLCESFQVGIEEVFDPSMGTVAGAGFTMSGLTARIDVKKGTRPIPAKTAAGMG